MKRVLDLITGPEDIGQSWLFWVCFCAAIVGFVLYPSQVSEFRATNVAYYMLNIPMALGLCLLWGYCGVLSFGQVAYFGAAGYVYGIIAGNMTVNPWGPTLGVLVALAACAIAAAIFGYFVFYARVQMWIVPILTLVLTLLLETLRRPMCLWTGTKSPP